MVRIGVTGPMASGKSTVARRFQERGAELIDGDALGWDVLRLPEVVSEIGTAFGTGVLARYGQIDRMRLGRLVFRDVDSMRRLNAIVQPVLLRRVREVLEAPGACVRVLDAAMLTTWGLEPRLDGVIEVETLPGERLRRLRTARGFTDAEAKERIQGQSLPPVRGARRLWRIENDGDRAELIRRADRIWAEIASLQDTASGEASTAGA